MQLTLEKNYIAGKPVRVDDLGGQLFGGEAQAHKFIVTQYAAQGSAETIAITGSVSGTLMASTGATVPLTGSLEDGKAMVVLDEDCYKVPGRFVLTIFVTSGDTTLCIYCGVGNVLRTSTDTVVYPTESLPNLAQLVDQVQAAIDSFPADLTALQAAIAENYDDLTYPIIAGTYAWHAGTLYKAKTDISAAESWTAAHWETVHAASDLAANVSQLKSALKNGSGYEIIPVVPNQYIDLSGSSVTMENGVPKSSGASATYSYGLLSCAGGEKCTVSGTGGNQTRLWAFISSTGTILDRASASATATNLVLTAPPNTAWIITHTNDSKHSYVGIPVVKQLSDVNDDIDAIENIESTNKTYILDVISDNCETEVITIIPGYYVDLSGTTVTLSDGVPQPSGTSTTYGYAAVNCSSGDTFTINGTGGSQPRLWGFVKNNGDIITTARASAGATASNLVITAPDNAAWLVINTSEDRLSYKGKLIALKVSDNSDRIDGIASQSMAEMLLDWRIGNIGAGDGIDYSSTTRARTSGYIPYNRDQLIILGTGVKFAVRYYGDDGTFVKGSPYWHTTGGSITEILAKDSKSESNLSAYRIVLAYSDDATIVSAISIGKQISIDYPGNMKTIYAAIEGNVGGIVINENGRGNCSIRCAKEQSYIDGSHPVIEWYLLEEPNTGRFYYSRDLSEKKYLFTFPYDAYKYSFGVLQNGDIIAVLDADSITTDDKNDANRVNPYVFLASEKWSICHEVDFGSSLKPCGWLGNCGFKVIANGAALFCEYTRQTTYTCNVWKLSGDPLDPDNWVATKSFVVTSTDNATLFKHAHMVMQDFYTGVCYFATGDDLIGAMLWASTDNGDTWTQLVSPDSDGQVNQYGYINGSEKYCRMLTMTFTKDYIYWATDSSSAVLHWLFKAQRDVNGVLDYSTVVDWVNIPYNNGASTYGTAYVPELNAIVLLDRCDIESTEMNLKLVTLDDGQLHTFGKLESASGSRNVGFRTRFSEWYPKAGLIHFGFALHIGRLTNAVNQNKGFNNSGSGDTPSNNINNLSMRVYKAGGNYGMVLNTDMI